MNDDIDAEEPYSEAEPTKFKQEQLVGNMVLELIRLAEPNSDLRTVVISIETSPAFSTQVKKMRKIISLYEDATAPNPEKNSHLKEERSALTFKSHGLMELRRDVDTLLNTISTIEEEMEETFKWNTTRKIEKITNLLHNIPELNHFFEQVQTYDAATTYDSFKTNLLKACSGIADRDRNQKQQIMASNSTQGVVEQPSSNSTDSTAADLFKRFQEWDNTSRNSRNTDRSYSRDRPRDRSYSRDRDRNRSRSNSRNRNGGRNWRDNSRGRQRERSNSASRYDDYSNSSSSRRARFHSPSEDRREPRNPSPARSVLKYQSQFQSPYQQNHRENRR